MLAAKCWCDLLFVFLSSLKSFWPKNAWEKCTETPKTFSHLKKNSRLRGSLRPFCENKLYMVWEMHLYPIFLLFLLHFPNHIWNTTQKASGKKLEKSSFKKKYCFPTPSQARFETKKIKCCFPPWKKGVKPKNQPSKKVFLSTLTLFYRFF